MSLYQIIKSLQATSGTKAKRAILEANRDNALLKEFLRMVLDPKINYWITKLPAPGKNLLNVALRDFDGADLSDLMQIANREFTGKLAKDVLAAKLAVLNTEGRELLELVIKRDIRAGVGETMVMGVFPGLIYVPPYQRCAKLDEKTKASFEAEDHFYVQTKSDGQFCYAIKRKLRHASDRQPQNVFAMSRQGSEYPDWVAHHITYSLPAGYVAMGELLVVRDGKVLDRKTGNGILNSVLSGDGTKFLKTDGIHYLAWDMVTEAEFEAGKSDRPYSQRLDDLIRLTGLERVPSWTVNSVVEAGRIQQEHLARKEEGTVWKKGNMKWRDCSSGDPDMVKAKVVFQADFRIRGYYEGEGKAAGMLGGLELETRDELIQFNCGSGFDDDMRKYLWSIRDTLLGKVAAIEGNDIVTSKSKETEAVYLPIFLEIREDKSVADNREEVWAEFEAAKEGRKL